MQHKTMCSDSNLPRRCFLSGGVGRTVVQLEQAAVPAKCSIMSERWIHWACIESEAGRGEHHLCWRGGIAADHDGLRSALRSGRVRRRRLPADQSAVQYGTLPEVKILPLHTVESASLWTLIYGFGPLVTIHFNEMFWPFVTGSDKLGLHQMTDKLASATFLLLCTSLSAQWGYYCH